MNPQAAGFVQHHHDVAGSHHGFLFDLFFVQNFHARRGIFQVLIGACSVDGNLLPEGFGQGRARRGRRLSAQDSSTPQRENGNDGAADHAAAATSGYTARVKCNEWAPTAAVRF